MPRATSGIAERPVEIAARASERTYPDSAINQEAYRSGQILLKVGDQLLRHRTTKVFQVLDLVAKPGGGYSMVHITNVDGGGTQINVPYASVWDSYKVFYAGK